MSLWIVWNLVGWAPAAAAEPSDACAARDPCATPRAAAMALVDDQVEACVDATDGVSEALVANQVREQLAARRAALVAEAIPADRDFHDGEGNNRVIPVPAVPELASTSSAPTRSTSWCTAS